MSCHATDHDTRRVLPCIALFTCSYARFLVIISVLREVILKVDRPMHHTGITGQNVNAQWLTDNLMSGQIVFFYHTHITRYSPADISIGHVP